MIKTSDIYWYSDRKIVEQEWVVERIFKNKCERMSRFLNISLKVMVF